MRTIVGLQLFLLLTNLSISQAVTIILIFKHLISVVCDDTADPVCRRCAWCTAKCTAKYSVEYLLFVSVPPFCMRSQSVSLRDANSEKYWPEHFLKCTAVIDELEATNVSFYDTAICNTTTHRHLNLRVMSINYASQQLLSACIGKELKAITHICPLKKWYQCIPNCFIHTANLEANQFHLVELL